MIEKKILIIQQTLLYKQNECFYAMPHVIPTLALIFNHFKHVSILSIVQESKVPDGFVKLENPSFEILELFQRRPSDNTLKLLFRYLGSFPNNDHVY